MSFLKSISQLFLGGQDDPTKIVLEGGQFYRTKANQHKVCLFPFSNLSIQPTSIESQYTLIVSRIVDEGEELESDDEFEFSFLIDSNLKVQWSTVDEENSNNTLQQYTWIDPKSPQSQPTRYIFSVDTSEVSDSKAEKFFDGIKECAQRRVKSIADSSSDIDSITKQLSQTKISKPVTRSTPKKPEVTNTNIDLSKYSILFETSCETYLYNPQNRTFDIHHEKSKIKFLSPKGKQFEYYLSVGPEDESSVQFVGQNIDEDMNSTFNHNDKAFIWIHRKNKLIYTWSVKLQDSKSFQELKKYFGKALYEVKLQMDLESVDAPTQKYIATAYSESYPLKREDEDDSSTDTDDYGDVTEPEEEDPRDHPSYDPMEDDSDFNRHMAVAYQNDRSFVIRGSRISVFKKDDEENDMKYVTRINKITDLKNKDIDVSQMMLHEQDKSLILRDKANKESIYKMDLEVGKIVEEYKSECFPCSFTFQNSKYNQINPDQTFLGLNPSSLFQIDPRINGDEKIVMDNFKQYSSKTRFTCAATTEDGRYAIANEFGEIRLFNQLGKNAKTALPALGDKIYGLDISNDGRYILATCATYLLVVDVLNHSDPDMKLGFDKAFPKDEKPRPIRLQLKPEHIAYIEDPINFTHARFNYGPDSTEKYILTSTGQYVVVWTFSKIKSGIIDSYSIKRFGDNVIADNFWFNDDSSIVVTLPHDVTLTKKIGKR